MRPFCEHCGDVKIRIVVGSAFALETEIQSETLGALERPSVLYEDVIRLLAERAIKKVKEAMK
jgi:hypothetical protein